MIKFENTEVIGWEAAIRGMRNPMNSWNKSDSEFGCEIVPGSHEVCRECVYAIRHGGNIMCLNNTPDFVLGVNDRDLMERLRNAGTDHRKFMRMIMVYVDITAPLYWWKEFDTYKVGTVANSCSTMHKIHAKPFTVNDISCDELMKGNLVDSDGNTMAPELKVHYKHMMNILNSLNNLRDLYLKTKNKKYWRCMIEMLPSSYNQKRTVMLNYEVLANVYKSRKNHKLDEWREHDDEKSLSTIGFCDWVKTLPYSELIIGEKK